MHIISETGIDNYARMAFFQPVAKWSNSYAVMELEWGNYGNDFRPVSAQDLVHWFGTIARNKNTNFYSNWDQHKPDCFDPLIHSTFSARCCRDH